VDLSRYSLEGRTVIITGGSGGIGRGCIRAFADAGADVVIASLPPDSIAAAVDEAESHGARALGIAVDATKGDQVASMVEQTLDHFGRIDVLVNLVGGAYSRRPDMPQQYQLGALVDLDEADFMTAYEANVKTAFLCSRAVVPQMKDQGKGVILNMGSISAVHLRHDTSGLHSAYGAAKGALHALTVHMAHQWGPEIRVNCVVGGYIEVRPPVAGRPEVNITERVALGRRGNADDVGSVMAFLASDAASYVNAALVPLDGGE
jgi:NAD(P)-dependent dehydrogenase (short-subunit alcohol dehydrogenase family)